MQIHQKFLLSITEASEYLMGYSDISVTMNTYTHLGLEDAAAGIAAGIE